MAVFNLNKESSIPLHVQLLNELRRVILAGELQPHTRVPSEPELLETLKISRTTIRQAWQAAEDEGLLYRVRGKGTYVAEPGGARTSQLVGFLIPTFRNTFDSQLLSGAERYLRERGYRLMFAHTDRDVGEENRLMREMWQEGVRGFLLWPAMGEGKARFLDQSRAIPTVFMDRPIDGLDYPCVAADHYQGAVQAMEHLIELKHTHIAFVARPHLQLWSVAERLRAYNDVMSAAGLEPRPPILVGDSSELGTWTNEHYYRETRGKDIEQLRAALRAADRPTALFAMSDLMALQIMRAAKLEGLRIPGDLSLVGFDDLDIVSHTDPPLTSVAQDPFRVGTEAARHLLELIAGRRPAQRAIFLPTHLIVRESTASLQERVTDQG